MYLSKKTVSTPNQALKYIFRTLGLVNAFDSDKLEVSTHDGNVLYYLLAKQMTEGKFSVAVFDSGYTEVMHEVVHRPCINSAMDYTVHRAAELLRGLIDSFDPPPDKMEMVESDDFRYTEITPYYATLAEKTHS